MPDDLLTEEQSLSILFAYDGMSIQISEQGVIDQAAPPSDDIGPLDGSPGFWYELRDDQGAVTWRHAAPWPFSFEIEQIPDESGQEEPATVADPAPQGAFVGIVPLDEDAHILALVGTPPPGAPEAALSDLAVFDLGVNA